MKIDIDFKIADSAINEFKKALLENSNQNDLVRVSVQGGGCSGFKYSLFFVDKEDFDASRDIIEDYDGMKLVVDKRSAFYLDGVMIDWKDEDDQKGFVFNNPNVKTGCGCSKGSCS
jgi:iron-sulfur cluster assembly protein